MTESNEPNEIAFHEQVTETGGRSLPVRLGIVAGSALLIVIGAVSAMGASPAPTTGADPATPGADPTPAASTPPGTTAPDNGRHGWFGPMVGPMGGMGMRGDFGGIGFGDITIGSIDGSSLALKTDDGWTRTIAVTDATKITRGGATIAIGDLAVGDQIRFSQDKAADGTYTVTAIVVVLPTVFGDVTAIDGNTLTVTQIGGTTATIHVDGATTYQVNGSSGSLSDIKVGSFLIAEGTQRVDGSLDAAAIRSGTWDRGGFVGPGSPGDHDGTSDPKASPAPSTGVS